MLGEDTPTQKGNIEWRAKVSPEGRDSVALLARPAVLPLFRPEVIAAQQAEPFGTALVIQPVSTTVLTLAAVAIAIGIGVLTFQGEYTRKAQVSGFLVPTLGLIKVHSLETGTIVEKRVDEGARVSKGDVLFIVSMERSNGETSEAQAAAMATLRTRRASLTTALAAGGQAARIETRGLQKQIDAMHSQLMQIAQEIKTNESRMASAQDTLRMYEQLFTRQLVSAEQREGRRKEFLMAQGDLQALQRVQIDLARQGDALQEQIAASDIKGLMQREATEREISSIDQQLTEYASRRTFVVTAPAGGTATAVLAEIGQTASPAQPLVSLLPSGTALQVHLFVPSSSIGFITPGQTVAVRYQAFPYQRFGSHSGRVTEISRTLILPGETALPFSLPEPAYRVIVTLDSQFVTAYGQRFALQSGMRLDASIWLDRRRLYQWLLDPLYSIRGGV